MKKLLTVLLAAAIVLTYSVPAIFADTTDPVATAKAEMSTAIDTYYGSNIVYKQSGRLVSVAGTNNVDGATYTVDTNLSKVAIDKTIADIKTELGTKIQAAYTNGTATTDAALKNYWQGLIGNDASGIVSVIFGTRSAVAAGGATASASGIDEKGAANGLLYTYAVANEKTLAQAAMDAVDTSLYTATDAALINNGDGNTASVTTSDGIDAHNNYGKLYLSNSITGAANTSTALANLIAAESNFSTFTGYFTKAASQTAALATAKAQAQAAITTAANSFLSNESTRLSTILNDSAQDATTVATTTSRLNGIEANVAKVKAYYAGLVEAATTKADVASALSGAQNAFAYTYAANPADKTVAEKAATALASPVFPTAFYNMVNQLATADMWIAYAESYAAAMKGEYNTTTGAATYNAETVDSSLTDLKAYLKASDLAGMKAAVDASYDAANDSIVENAAAINQSVIGAWLRAATPTAVQETSQLSAYKAQAILDITETQPVGVTNTDKVSGTTLVALKGTYAKGDWASKYQSDIASIQSAYKAKINYATSKADIIALVKEAQAKMDAVALNTTKAGTVSNSVLANAITLGYANAPTGLGGTIEQYANSKKATGTYSAKTIADAIQSAYDVLNDAVLAEKNTNLTNAQIQTILKNNYAAALAKIDAMKSTSELTTAANAVIASIAALPTTVTLADKDKYLATEKLYEDYLDLAGTTYTDITNQSLLDAYMTNLISLEKDAVVAQIKALPSTITVDNKDAVEAAEKAMSAYEDAYSGYADTINGVANSGFAYSYSDVTSYYADKLTAARTALDNALQTNAAKLIAAIPALPTLADADAVKAARAAYDSLSDLQKSTFSSALVAKLAAAEKALNAEKIAATQSLKLTAKSAAVKGKMTITWKVSGTVVTGVKYQVMRSLHKNYGYKYMKTTSLKKYVNTKNLKAGKTYYYKVRAYITVDGVKYYSDWSNKAFRVAK